MSRPVCGHCGKKYGKRRTVDVIVRRDNVTEPFPSYRGSLVVIKDVTIGSNALVTYRTHWDGSWSKPYEPFCTLRCALDYARKAYRQSEKTK